MTFYSFDLGPMTLILKLDLGIFKMYLHTKKMKLLALVVQKLKPELTDPASPPTPILSDKIKIKTRFYQKNLTFSQKNTHYFIFK